MFTLVLAVVMVIILEDATLHNDMIRDVFPASMALRIRFVMTQIMLFYMMLFERSRDLVSSQFFFRFK